ncbi:MAG: hypothetical protein AAGA77_19070 [Bacteroidota bacterium]
MSIFTENVVRTVDFIASVNAIRHRMQSRIIKRTAQVVERNDEFPQFMRQGLNLLNAVSDSNIEFETRMTQRFKDMIRNSNPSSRSYSKHARKRGHEELTIEKEIESDQAIRISVSKNNEFFKIPFKLNNVLDTEQKISIRVSPMRRLSGETILIDQIQVEQEEMVLEANETCDIIALLLVNDDLKLHEQYAFDIFISGEKSKQLSMIATIVP